jgi:hypothetical protein
LAIGIGLLSAMVLEAWNFSSHRHHFYGLLIVFALRSAFSIATLAAIGLTSSSSSSSEVQQKSSRWEEKYADTVLAVVSLVAYVADLFFSYWVCFFLSIFIPINILLPHYIMNKSIYHPKIYKNFFFQIIKTKGIK